MEKDEKTKNKIVRTYAEDMAHVIENDTEGLVKKIIHGEEQHELEKRNLSPESKKNKFFMLASVALLMIAAAAFSFFFFRKDNNTVPVAKQFAPIIFNDKSTFLEIAGFNKDEIAQTVANQVKATKVKTGGIEGIYLTENKNIVGLRRFISLIKSTLAPDTNKLLVSDNFMMGVVSKQANQDTMPGTGFFILIKVRSAADIFDSMRAWENKMFFDLHTFLQVPLSSETNYLFTKDFEDGIIENKNSRILYYKDGKPALMYIFADDNSVIITDAQYAAHQITLSLASGRMKQ